MIHIYAQHTPGAAPHVFQVETDDPEEARQVVQAACSEPVRRVFAVVIGGGSCDA